MLVFETSLASTTEGVNALPSRQSALHECHPSLAVHHRMLVFETSLASTTEGVNA